MKKLSFIILLLAVCSIHAKNLNGRYKSGCYPIGKGNLESFSSELNIKEESFQGKLFLYKDQKCGELKLIVDYTSEINYPHGLNVGPLDHKVERALLIVFDPESLKSINKSGRCGDHLLSHGTPKQIEGHLKCTPFAVPKEGVVAFDMFQLEKDELSFGAYPLLWVNDESRRPLLTSRVVHKKQ